MLIPYIICALTITAIGFCFIIIREQARQNEVLEEKNWKLTCDLEEARAENEMWRDNPPKVYDPHRKN